MSKAVKVRSIKLHPNAQTSVSGTLTARAIPLPFTEVWSEAAQMKAKLRPLEASHAIENQLRLVIDTIPIMAWTVQPDGIVDFLNQRWIGCTAVHKPREGCACKKAGTWLTGTASPQPVYVGRSSRGKELL